MWDWLKSMKGRKLSYLGKQLWHTIEKPEAERLMSKKVSHLMERLRGACNVQGDEAKAKFPDTDYDRGIIFTCAALNESGVARVFQIPRFGKDFEPVMEGWTMLHLDKDRPENDPSVWCSEANQLQL